MEKYSKTRGVDGPDGGSDGVNARAWQVNMDNMDELVAQCFRASGRYDAEGGTGDLCEFDRALGDLLVGAGRDDTEFERFGKYMV